MMYWTAVEALMRGEVDLAVGQFGKLPPGLTSQTLFKDDYCIVARKGHPRIKGRITPNAYRDAGHVFVLPPTRQDGSPINPAESAVIYGTIPDRRQVAASAYVQRFSAALMMAATTDVIADIPRRYAEQYAGKLGLQVLNMPFEWPGFTVQIVRRADHRDPATDWLHQKVRDAVE
jgi:DNA-binding transcriptional LysR family regulator